MMYSKLVTGALVTLTLLLLNASAFYTDVDCPKLPLRCGCTRDKDEKPRKIQCRKAYYAEMKTVFNDNLRYNFKNMEIVRSKMDNTSLLTNAFVEKLELQFCQIRNFDLFESLDTMKKLKSLVIEGVAMERISFNQDLRDDDKLSQLKEFTLLDCPEGCDGESKQMIEYLPKNLTSITIRWCRLTLDESHSFGSILNLERLQLNHNDLTAFERSYLPEPATQLRFLSLSNNPIRSLPEDMFSEMPALSTVELVAMELTTLKCDVFKPLLNQQKLIELAHNPIICNCNNSWLVAELANWKGQIPRCASPEVFAGRRMSELQPKEMCQIPGEDFQETTEQYCDAKPNNTPINE